MCSICQKCSNYHIPSSAIIHLPVRSFAHYFSLSRRSWTSRWPRKKARRRIFFLGTHSPKKSANKDQAEYVSEMCPPLPILQYTWMDAVLFLPLFLHAKWPFCLHFSTSGRSTERPRRRPILLTRWCIHEFCWRYQFHSHSAIFPPGFSCYFSCLCVRQWDFQCWQKAISSWRFLLWLVPICNLPPIEREHVMGIIFCSTLGSL